MNKDLFSIIDKIVVITGGMGQLGQQYAIALLEHGAKVVILDTETNKANLNDRLAGYSTDNFMLLEADVTNRNSLENALKRISIHWDIPHALINNAALDSPPNAPVEENGPFENYPENSCRVFGRAHRIVRHP